MLLVQALAAANRAWVERAGARMNAATLNIDSGTYTPQMLMRDTLRSVVSDPVQWYLDFSRLTYTDRILIDARLNPSRSSDFIPVRDPQKTEIVPLVRMGGNETLVPDTHVFVDKPTPGPPPIPDGTVVVRVNVTGFPAGIYVGFLLVDNLPVTEVIVRR